MFPEQDQSAKANLRMFKFDNKLIWKKNTCNGDHLGAWDDVSRAKCFDKKHAPLKNACNCLSPFCFINFGVSHGFFKKIYFGALCLRSLKQNH